MAKIKTPTDEKFSNQDIDLFEVLAALDKKDYDYYDRLTPEQQKKVTPYVLTHWMSAIKASGDLQSYYLQSTNYHANTHLLNELISKHPSLQWKMLCAASPGVGKQFHQWIPHISTKVSSLKETAKLKDMREYYKKIYPKASSDMVDEISAAFISEQKRKCHISTLFPNLKYDDIETLSQVITDDEIEQYEQERGN
jgi:hypothetical protein